MREADELLLIDEVGRQLDAMQAERLLRTWPRMLATLTRDPRLRNSLQDLRDEGETFAREHLENEAPWNFHLLQQNGRLLAMAEANEFVLAGCERAVRSLREHPAWNVVIPLDPRRTVDLGQIAILSEAHATVAHALVSAGEDLARPCLGYTKQVRDEYPIHRRQLEFRWLDPTFAVRRLDDLALLLAGLEGRSDTRIVVERTVTGDDETVQDELLISASDVSPPSPELIGFAEAMRGEMVTVLGELRLRAGGRRSRIALIDRYKARAEWHERAELRARADDRLLGGKPEERLRDAFARWLFDQGLDPISEPHVAQLRADVLDPFVHPALIVEAKQYLSSNRLKYKIQRGFVQATETASQLYGPMRTDEVFLLIFRRGGDLVAPPVDPVRVGQLEVYLRIVDLVEAEKSGSRSKASVVELSSDDLVAWLEGAATDAPKDDDEIEAEETPPAD